MSEEKKRAVKRVRDTENGEGRTRAIKRREKDEREERHRYVDR